VSKFHDSHWWLSLDVHSSFVAANTLTNQIYSLFCLIPSEMPECNC